MNRPALAPWSPRVARSLGTARFLLWKAAEDLPLGVVVYPGMSVVYSRRAIFRRASGQGAGHEDGLCSKTIPRLSGATGDTIGYPCAESVSNSRPWWFHSGGTGRCPGPSVPSAPSLPMTREGVAYCGGAFRSRWLRRRSRSVASAPRPSMCA